jgi:hypothetical protein
MQLADEHELRQALLARARARGAERLSLAVVARRIDVPVTVLEAFVSGANLPRETLAALPTILISEVRQAPQKPAGASNRPSGHRDEVMDKTLTGRALKVTIVLDPIELAAMADPTTARVALRICVADRVVVADVAGKSLRKARATIAEFGVDNVAVIIQGKLVGDAVIEAGLVAQPKAPKAQVSAG